MTDNVIRDYCRAIKKKTSMGDYIGALGIADRLVYAFPHSDKGYYYRGICYYGLERYEDSIANYKMALKIDPLSAKTYFNLGTCYQQLKQFDLALINIGKALILFSRKKDDNAKLKCIDAIQFIEYKRNG